MCEDSIAYILLQCKTTRIGSSLLTPVICVADTNMLVSEKPHGPNPNHPLRPKAKPPRPNASPPLLPVGIYVALGPLAFGPVLVMYISCCLCQFHSRWVANGNTISGGIWGYMGCRKWCFVWIKNYSCF